MTTSNIIPFSFENHAVRIVTINDQPWFIASDVAKALEYLTAKDMARNLDDDEKGRHIVPTPSGDQEMTIINESGLYSAILRSRKAAAKRFKKWVTAEVLPSIRRSGSYTPRAAQKAITNKLTTEQQQTIKEMVKARVEVLPKDKQAKGAITCWSAIKSKFGASYKDITQEHFSEALSLVARVTLEGEFLGPEVPAEANRLDINFSADWWLTNNPALRRLNQFNQRQEESLMVSVSVINTMDSPSPLNLLLVKLSKSGYNVDACRMEMMALRHHLEMANMHIENALHRQKAILEGVINLRRT